MGATPNGGGAAAAHKAVVYCAGAIAIMVCVGCGGVFGRRLPWNENLPWPTYCAGGVSIDDAMAVSEALAVAIVPPVVKVQVLEFLNEAARGITHKGMFFVGAHRQGKTTVANIVADALLVSSGRNVKRCSNGQCEVQNGKVLVSASSVEDPNWLLQRVAEATKHCEMAVVIIDDLGLGTEATAVNSMFVVQKLLEGGLIPYINEEGKTGYFKFDGLVIITANDYALEVSTYRNMAEICFAQHSLAALLATQPYHECADKIAACVEHFQQPLADLVTRAMGLSRGNVNPNSWGAKWTFMMFPLVMPCGEFIVMARAKWMEITHQMMPGKYWTEIRTLAEAKSPCNLQLENPEQCCLPTGHVMEAVVALANEWLLTHPLPQTIKA